MTTETTTTAVEPYTYTLTPAEYAATREKIAKVNDRAAKRGFTGFLRVEGERVERTYTDQFGFDVTEVVYKTRVTGDAPSYNGWVFEARIDRVGDTFTIATAPGVEHVSRDLVQPGVCEHCGFNRQRNNTYLVRNVETGEVVNVGSTCIKDFLGWDASVVFFTDSDVDREIGGFAGTGERSYSVDTVLAVAYAATRAFGWVRSGDYYGVPTVSRVWKVLSPFGRMTDQERAEIEQIKAYAAEANAKAAEIKAFVLSDEFAGTSTYVDNLKVACSVEAVTDKQMGLLASAPQAYVRHQETAVERAAKQARWDAEKAAKAQSDYIGEVGDKVEFTGTISAIRFIEGQYGTTVLYTFLTTDGNLVKWFASREALGTEEGVTVTVKGTVKGHDEYRETKSTVVTRCKPVETSAAA